MAPRFLRAAAAGLFFFLFFPGARAVSDPVAYWSFDDDFTATVGGSDFNGIAVNGVTIDHSRSRFGGGAARFRRASQQYIHIQESPFTQGSHTYAAWYYLDLPAIGGTDRYMVLEASDGSTWPASYGLRLNGTEQAGNVFTHDNGATGATPSILFPSGAHRAWRHIAVTYDAETFRLEMFLDGGGAGMLLLRPDATMLSPSAYLNIGSHREPSGRNWEGWIDEVAVWDRVLSQEEIKLLQELRPNEIGHHGLAGYERWIGGFDIPEALRGAEADANGDGVSNLAKYAFGLHPLEPAQAGGLPSILVRTEGGESRLIMEIPRNKNALGLELAVEAATELGDWHEAEVIVLEDEPERLRVEVIGLRSTEASP